MSKYIYLFFFTLFIFSCKKSKKTNPPVTNNPPPVNIIAPPYARGIDSSQRIIYVYDTLTSDGCFLVISYNYFGSPFIYNLTKLNNKCETIWKKELFTSANGGVNPFIIKETSLNQYTVFCGNEIKQYLQNGDLTISKTLAIDVKLYDIFMINGTIKILTSIPSNYLNIVCTTYNTNFDLLGTKSYADTSSGLKYGCFRANGDIYLLTVKDSSTKWVQTDIDCSFLNSNGVWAYPNPPIQSFYKTYNNDIFIEWQSQGINVNEPTFIIDGKQQYINSFSTTFVNGYVANENSNNELICIHRSSSVFNGLNYYIEKYTINSQHNLGTKKSILLDTSIIKPVNYMLTILGQIQEPNTDNYFVFANLLFQYNYSKSVIFKIDADSSIVW